MYEWICMYVCVYVCMYMYVCVCMYMYVCLLMYLCMYVCVGIYVFMCVCTCMYYVRVYVCMYHPAFNILSSSCSPTPTLPTNSGLPSDFSSCSQRCCFVFCQCLNKTNQNNADAI